MNRDELKKAIAIALRSTGGYFLRSHAFQSAEACLSAIEQSGCTICPNEPTDEMRIAGAFQIHHDPILQDHMKAQSCFEAMLSSSPFNTQGDGVSCNRPEQAEQPVSAQAPLQSDIAADAALMKALGSVAWLADLEHRQDHGESTMIAVGLLRELRDGYQRIAERRNKPSATNSRSQIEEPRSGDTDPSP